MLRFFFAGSFLGLCTLLCLDKCSAARTLRSRSLDSTIICTLAEIDVEAYGPDENDDLPNDYVCETTNADNIDQVYTLDVPPAVVQDLLQQYGSHVKITNPIVNDTVSSLSFHSGTKVEKNDAYSRNRLLTSSEGVRTVLILRVTYRNKAPSPSALQIAGRFFGIGPFADGISASSQLQDCSHGKLLLTPATGPGINYGVVELSIDDEVSGEWSVISLQNKAITLASELYGDLQSQFEHVSIVFPSHDDIRYKGNSNYLAYAYLPGYRSVYRDAWAIRLSAVVHELGHNLGLHHSGEDKLTYGDMTGFMGYGIGDTNGPRTCFNAQKNWLLGWYSDRSSFLTAEDFPYTGFMVFFGDYWVSRSYHDIVIKLQSGDERLYMQYNRAKGINNGTLEYPDELVIVGDTINESPTKPVNSWIKATLAIGQSYRWPQYDGSNDLIIRVCSAISGAPDRLRISIHLDDGVQRGTCNKVWTPPTCDDNQDVEFYVTDGLVSKHCGWLAREDSFEKWSETLCVPGHVAFDLCEETCGQCSDDCHDDNTATFYVNSNQGYQDCTWLSERPPWQTNLCQEDHDAYHLCPESCDVCDRRK